MKKEKRPMPLIGLLSVFLLLLCLLLLYSFPKKQQVVTEIQYETELVTYTQPIYVYVEPEQDSSNETEKETEELYWTVKAHGEMIGVFDKNMHLIRIIEVYTKTLPEADRKLLEEGIVVRSKKEYQAIVEDYTA